MKFVAAWARKWWALLGATVVLAVVGAGLVLFPRKDEEEDLARALDKAKRRAEEKIAGANARAAIDLHIIATKDEQAVRQLEAILAESDEERRLNALIAFQLRLRKP